MAIVVSDKKTDFVLQIDGGPPSKLRVALFEGEEEMSKPFLFTIEIVSEDGALDLDGYLGKPGLLTISGGESTRYVNGVISRFEQITREQVFSTYEADLVPAIWLMSLTSRSRIFQNKKVPEIIEQVLKEGGLTTEDYTLSLQATYPKWEYITQYRESDLNFVSRLMEEEGIFYFFQHSDSRHKMVIADTPNATGPCSGKSEIPFHPPGGLKPENEHIHLFRLSHEVRTGKVVLKDYNYEKPSLDLTASNQAKMEADREFYDYPGDFAEPEDGKRLAQVYLEVLRATRNFGTGESVVRRLEPGHRITLKGYPRTEFDKEYLVVKVSHKGEQPQVREQETASGKPPSYTNEFECIPAEVTFRPDDITPKPIVHGTQTALVVGPRNEKLYLDDKGRAKVLFYWDREGKKALDDGKGETCSCWVRVSQGYAGPTHGIQFPPLVGDEVVVDFLEGDPNNPLIVGRVYNATNMPPLKPDDRIQNVILTPYQHRVMLDDKTAAITLSTKEAQTVFMQDLLDDGKGNKSNKDFGHTVKIATKDGHYIQLAKGDKHKGLLIQTETKHKIELRDDPNPGIFIEDKDGKIFLHLDTQNKTINLINKAETAINIEVPKGKITLKAAEILLDAENKVEIKSGKDVILKGTDVKAEGAKSFDVKSNQTKIEGSTSLDMKGTLTKIEGSGTIDVKGGMATFEGSGMATVKAGGVMTVKGAVVMIN